MSWRFPAGPGVAMVRTFSDPYRVPRMDWFKRMYFAPLRWLAVMIGVFARNRHRVTAITSRQRVAAALQVLSILTLLAWLLIWVIADEADRRRLTEAVSDYWSGIRGGSAASGNSLQSGDSPAEATPAEDRPPAVSPAEHRPAETRSDESATGRD